MTNTANQFKYNVGQWVEVTARNEGQPLVLIGKITEACAEYAVATCRTASGERSFTYSDDTEGYIIFRRMTQADWTARKRAKARR
jgi:hypothetical protein